MAVDSRLAGLYIKGVFATNSFPISKNWLAWKGQCLPGLFITPMLEHQEYRK